MVQAYDQHLNMVLGEVTETHTVVEIDEDTFEEIVKVDLAPCPYCVSQSESLTLYLVPSRR